MKFSETQRFSSPLAQLQQLYFNPDYYQKKYERLGMTDLALVSSEQRGDIFETAWKMSLMPADKLPKLAERFIDPNRPIAVLRRARWEMSKNQGQLSIEVEQTRRVNLSASLQLRAEGDNSVNQQDWEITVDVPLIGEKLAKLLAEDIRKKTRADEQVTQQLLNNLA